MDVLLSIKPIYVNKIMSGEKKYEFRKSTFRSQKDVRRVYVYSSSPVKKIVGFFLIGDIIEDTPTKIWQLCREFAGIGEKDFYKYYQDKKVAFAISIENFKPLSKPVDPFKTIKNFHAPQSFCYIEEDLLDKNNIN